MTNVQKLARAFAVIAHIIRIRGRRLERERVMSTWALMLPPTKKGGNRAMRRLPRNRKKAENRSLPLKPEDLA